MRGHRATRAGLRGHPDRRLRARLSRVFRVGDRMADPVMAPQVGRPCRILCIVAFGVNVRYCREAGDRHVLVSAIADLPGEDVEQAKVRESAQPLSSWILIAAELRGKPREVVTGSGEILAYRFPVTAR